MANFSVILAFLAVVSTVVYAQALNSNEPDWSLIEEFGLFKSPANLVKGRVSSFFLVWLNR